MSSDKQRPGKVQPKVDLTVDGRPETRYIERLEVIEQDAKHVILLVTVWYVRPKRNGRLVKNWKPNLGLWKDNSRAVVRFGWSPKNVNVVYGYVEGHKVSVRERNDGHVPVTYTIRGTSREMQKAVRKNWTGVTASHVARRIAKKYGLRPVVDKTDVVYEDLTQDESDFRFLATLAKRSGRRFWVNNGELHFLDPYRSLHTQRTGYPTFELALEPNRRDSIREIHVVTGANMPDGGQAVDRVAYYQDPNTGEIVKVREAYRGNEAFTDDGSPDPSVEVQFSRISAQSYSETKSLLKAENRNNRNWIQAEGTLRGDPRVQPGSVINLTGLGLSKHEAGLWFVEKVVHKMDRLDPQEPRSWVYDMDVVLGRDRDAKDVTIVDSPDSVLPVVQVPVRVVNDKWRALCQGGTVDG